MYKYFCNLSLGLKFGEFYFGFTGYYNMPMIKASKIWNKLSLSLSVILSLVHVRNLHPGANLHPGCKFAPGVYFWPCERCFKNLHPGANLHPGVNLLLPSRWCKFICTREQICTRVQIVHMNAKWIISIHFDWRFR